jgi:hypothetical protein
MKSKFQIDEHIDMFYTGKKVIALDLKVINNNVMLAFWLYANMRSSSTNLK